MPEVSAADASSRDTVHVAGAGRQGRLVVLAAFCGVMVGFGSLLVFTFSVFVKPMAASFGWSRESISAAFGLAAMSVAVCSPALGHLLDRRGPRWVVLPCMAVFGCAFASLGFLTPSIWRLYAVFIVLGMVGNGTTQMGYSRAVATWFDSRRGMALALVMAGAGTGAMVLPPLAQWLIHDYGWRAAYFTLGGLILVLGIPLTALFVRERPHAHSHCAARLPGMSVRDALGQPAFWILVASLFLGSVSVNAAIAHISPLLTDRGVSPATAALAASALGLSSFAGRLLTGALLDRFFGPRVGATLLAVTAIGILLLARAATGAAGMAAAALIGAGVGAEADFTPYVLTRYFGLRSFSTLYGFTWTAYAIAGGIGPVLMGKAFDATGSYASLLALLAVGMAAAALLLLLLPRYPTGVFSLEQ
jgi:predicted MFS family arabinose efflux permease